MAVEAPDRRQIDPREACSRGGGQAASRRLPRARSKPREQMRVREVIRTKGRQGGVKVEVVVVLSQPHPAVTQAVPKRWQLFPSRPDRGDAVVQVQGRTATCIERGTSEVPSCRGFHCS